MLSQRQQSGSGPLKTFAHNALAVRLLLQDMETAVGLDDLSEGERNLLSALVLCGGTAGIVTPGTLRQHPLVHGLTHPTYHRMLRSLIERGMVGLRTEPTGRRGYAVLWEVSAEADLPKVQPAS